MGTFRCWAQINKDNLGFPSVFVETCMSSILACNCKEGSFEREERKKNKLIIFVWQLSKFLSFLNLSFVAVFFFFPPNILWVTITLVVA